MLSHRLICTPLFLALLTLLPAGDRLAAQAPGGSADTFADAATRALVERAREARWRTMDDLASYEAVLRERVYAGLHSWGFRRERALFEQERVARIRWTREGERAVLWIGARRAIPLVGADTGLPDPDGSGAQDPGEDGKPRDTARERFRGQLLEDADLPSFVFEPVGGDRLAFGESWALHPLSDTAAAHYRFLPGDTLRLGLPDRELVLYEVRVRPRRSDFRLVAASLWLDAETAALVRASYRPARAFDLALDDPEGAADVPGILEPVEAEISLVAVEYSLHELRYWLPRRVAMEGEGRLAGAVRIPLRVEWTMGDYQVNEDSGLPLVGDLPPGWDRNVLTGDEAGDAERVTILVPATDSLLTAPELTPGPSPATPTAYSPEEIRGLRDELEGLLPRFSPYRPRIAWGVQQGLLRYNRVEGLSVGVAAEAPLSPRTRVTATARIGTGDREPYGSLALEHGPQVGIWEGRAYRRLVSMNDWDDPFSPVASLTSLVLGSDRGEFFRATGVTLGYRKTGRRTRWRLEGFAETQRPVSLTTEFYLLGELGLRSDTVQGVRPADPADVSGLRARLDWYHGLDPRGLLLTGGLRGEVGRGDVSYQRASARVSASHPLGRRLVGGVELQAGAVWGSSIPVQREYFLGGAATLRGFNTNELLGESFWRGRAEVGGGPVAARLVLFADAGWIGPKSAFGNSALDPDELLLSAGVGVSVLDGLFRLDLARAIRGESRWKVHASLDALF